MGHRALIWYVGRLTGKATRLKRDRALFYKYETLTGRSEQPTLYITRITVL